jgi:hypothetical protein
MRSLSAVILISGSSFGLIVACSTTDDRIGYVLPPPTATPPLVADSGADASLPEAPRLLACVGTSCPLPFTTCPSSPSLVCGTNLDNDPENCGACGVSCNGFDGLNLNARCVKGACLFECAIKAVGGLQIFRDCNDLLDDGCETDVGGDARNCGSCGHACTAGERCILGKCGCPQGQVDCEGRCINTQSDDQNCKSCGNVCQDPATPCSPMPANTKYGCAQGECGALKCEGGFADCNGDVGPTGCASDGCETDTTTSTNCGGCGIQCLPDQECKPDDQGRPKCQDTCAKLGLAECFGKCRDFVNDKEHCGVCGNNCVYNRPHMTSSCQKGMCLQECMPGWADCNGDISDGCEIDITSHPANCGACGTQCDLRAGQPCIEGKCLMVECDGGVVAK